MSPGAAPGPVPPAAFEAAPPGGGPSCLLPPRPAPCTVVIFGASGDLAARMILPALYDLHRHGALPGGLAVVGAARTPWSDEAFREHARRALERAGRLDQDAWAALAPRLFYQPLDYADPGGCAALAARLDELDARLGTGGNRLFYLATPPTVYADLARNLGAAGLARQGRGFSRIVVEKPFGRDLGSARALDAALHEHFAEQQIFRIDHYLAKETVQNILLLRFANAVFEPLWNRRYVESVTCAAMETLGVGHRAGYYEHSGVLRDMFQNHMMQLLALVAMEPPPAFDAEAVRDEKAKVYRALRPFDPDRLDADLVLGQYGPGAAGGAAAPGYRQEPGVAPDSTTPTFAAMRLWVDNWRWQGVPFHLVSGKALREKLTRIVVRFREVPHSLFRHILGEDIGANRLILDIHPGNAVSLAVQAKLPGARLCLQPATMRFDFDAAHAPARALDAYEKVLLDCMLGDQMLFWRQDAVEQCWGFLTPVLERCEACGAQGAPALHGYAAGSWGPAASLETVQGLF
ncbi:glucose-6-phosphate dehydrogenase [Desulfocurvus vexinensis]|uniref:glucose-6-phosphate dehydrogenase n=1 Tax=Desulfocurvus vexinensis TaxID=399548 RepID=UPI0004B05599|nr:glucose-6-phosphate dehydrogenase [Desulfocurvus vexinensis]